MTTHYIWDVVNDSYLMETDGDGNVTAEYTTEPVPYGRVISQRRGNATSFYHYDGQGSTRQLTDENGNVTDEYTYSAFGETVASSGATVNPFGYAGILGYYTNSETNDVYARARAVRPTLGRWLSVDPLGFTDGSNLFMYVANNPVYAVDPSGQQYVGFDPHYCPPTFQRCTGFKPPAPTEPRLSSLDWAIPTTPTCPRWLNFDANGYPQGPLACHLCKITNLKAVGAKGTSRWNDGFWLDGNWTGTYVLKTEADCCCFHLPVIITIDFNVKFSIRIYTRSEALVFLLTPKKIKTISRVLKAPNAIVTLLDEYIGYNDVLSKARGLFANGALAACAQFLITKWPPALHANVSISISKPSATERGRELNTTDIPVDIPFGPVPELRGGK